MIVNFDCEFCGRGQAVAADKAGRTVTCRYCGGDCVVPQGAGGSAPPAPQTAQAPPPPQAIGSPVGGGPEKTTYHPPPQGDPFRPPPAQNSAPYGAPPPQGGNPYSAPQADLGRRRPPSGGDMVPADVNNAANIAIVLAALAWVFSCVLLAPFAIWQASRADSLARQYGVKPPTTIVIAKVLAWIQLLLTVGMIALVILMAALQ